MPRNVSVDQHERDYKLMWPGQSSEGLGVGRGGERKRSGLIWVGPLGGVA